MEQHGLQTDIAFIKGVETGTALVKAKLLEDGYEGVQETSTPISVIQPFMLIPSYPIYILPHSSFKFQVARIFQAPDSSQIQKIVPLPSNDFEFQLQKNDPGTVTNSAIVSSKDKLSQLTLTASDTTLPSNNAEGIVHVVAPEKLDMEIIDVTQYQKSQYKIKELYFEEKEDFGSRED